MGLIWRREAVACCMVVAWRMEADWAAGRAWWLWTEPHWELLRSPLRDPRLLPPFLGFDRLHGHLGPVCSPVVVP